MDDPLLRRALRALVRPVRARRQPPVAYRNGIPNRADEIVGADPVAQALIEAGVLTIGDYSYRRAAPARAARPRADRITAPLDRARAAERRRSL